VADLQKSKLFSFTNFAAIRRAIGAYAYQINVKANAPAIASAR
jgi:hypothetical protein